MKRYNIQIIFSKFNIAIGISFVILFMMLFAYIGEDDTIRVYLLAILGFTFIIEEFTKGLTGQYSNIFIGIMSIIKQLLIAILFFLCKDLFFLSVYCFSVYIYTSLQLLVVFKSKNIEERVSVFGQMIIPIVIVFSLEAYSGFLSLDEFITCLVLIIIYILMLKIVQKYLIIKDKIIENSDVNSVTLNKNDNVIIGDDSVASSKVISRMLGMEYNKNINNKYDREININDFRRFSHNIDISDEIHFLASYIMEKIQGADYVLILLENDGLESQKHTYTIGIETVIGKELVNRTKEAVKNGQLDNIILNSKDTFINTPIDYSKFKFLKSDDGVKSLLFAPLLKYNTTVGACIIISKKEDLFKEEQIPFYNILFSELIQKCERTFLCRQLEQLAIKDALTGVYNRRYLTELFNEISNEVRNAKNSKFKMSLVLFDLDRFKRINDTYGHLFGDTVIRICAKIAKDITDKNNGIISRYGGEEFVIIFPGKSVKETQDIVSKIMNEISNFEFAINDKVVRVNISVGITCYPEITKEVKNLLKEVDWAMYYSKQNGRGIATVYSKDVLKYLKMIGEI